MEENKCCEAVVRPAINNEQPEDSYNTISRAQQTLRSGSRKNDLFLMLLVLVQTIQSSWAAAAANVMVHSELSDGQFSRWISLDSFKFKETSLTPEAG